MPPHTCGTDKDFGGVKMTGAVVFEGRENDVLFAKHGTRREVHASLWLRQQRRYDMQRIGDDMQPKVAEMRAHLQRRRAAMNPHDPPRTRQALEVATHRRRARG